ncbi:30S ribosomal protein S9 [Candidatus Woesearchaeota archaeon]|nr:30S ribosomal protein S9 [Candidatus Woesearchaeota archaeon]
MKQFLKVVHVSGRRKRAVARATLSKGSGIVRINGVLLESYTPNIYQLRIREPLIIAGDKSKEVDISINIVGGGIASQSQAARLAIGKALSQHDSSLKNKFLEYDRSLLVADVRRKESKKPNTGGKARAKTQKSYR